MIRNDEQLLAIADLFGSAALDGDWPMALNALADVCGAESGELIGVGADAAVPFNWVTRADPRLTENFEVMGFGSPAVNPRVRHGIRAPILTSWHEVQCSTEEELRRNFEYADFCRRFDIPFGSQSTLMRQDGMLIGLAVLRGQARGVPQGDERIAFEAIAPHVRSAVLTQMALERQGSTLISGALDGLSVAGFLCDRRGVVKAVTPRGDQALVHGALRLKAGRLGAVRPSDARALEDAITAATLPTGARPAHQSLVLRHGHGASEVQVVDVIRLPVREFAFGFEPRVLVAVRGGRRGEDELPMLLGDAFALTGMEAKIAVRLADGQSREAIAAERQVSVETVRSHIKKIFAKLDVRREAELAARLRQLS